MPIVADVMRRLMGLKSMIGSTEVSTTNTTVNIPVARTEVSSDRAIHVTHPSESSDIGSIRTLPVEDSTRTLPDDSSRLESSPRPTQSDRSGPSRAYSV